MTEQAEQTTPETPAAPAPQEPTTPAPEHAAIDQPGDLKAVIQLARQANPDAIPDMIAGATVPEIMQSIEPAKTAYQTAVNAAIDKAMTGKTVPAGGAKAPAVDLASIPTSELIRRGIQTSRKK